MRVTRQPKPTHLTLRIQRIHLRYMRKYSPLDALLPDIRQRILSATLLRPEKSWYLSELAKHLGARPSSLQRELATLTRAGIFRTRLEGNRIYYRPDADCPFLPELTGLIVKTTGVLGVLRHAIGPLAERMNVAFVYGSLAGGDYRSASDIDLMVIGNVKLADLSKSMRKAEQRIGRAVNANVYSRDEIARKLAAGHHFLTSVLASPKLFVVGQGNDLEAIAGERARPATRHEQK
jgi:DNA-binding transcriptional ArsR family regulator